jgi:acid stress-induced BolA-like protein IbaG/YrbA
MILVFVTLRAVSTYKKAELIIMDPAEIKALIENGLENADVKVYSDDNTHYAAVVVAAAFAGKRRIQRHQLVYGCLGSLMGNEIHAMSIRAHTPEEWRDLEQAG